MSKHKVFADPQQLNTAQLNWRNGQPYSVDYNDVYYSSICGIAEKKLVFIDANRLAQRWSADPNQNFCILEAGFGSGLNFLLCWRLWQQIGGRGRLNYVAIEGYPLHKNDLFTCHAMWPQLTPWAQQLQQQYPLPIKGFHRLLFDRLSLTLVQADMATAIKQIDVAPDAIFLDGFTPARNPAMWQSQTLSMLAQLGHVGTTISTYSAARVVKDALTKAGFVVMTQPGYGLKRHRLAGHLPTPPIQPEERLSKPWFERPSRQMPARAKIAIVGAGLSGAATAWSLAERGYQVSLFEQGDRKACGASGNRQAILYANLPDNPTLLGQWHQQGLQHSVRLLQQTMADTPSGYQLCGVLQLARKKSEEQRLKRIVERGFPAAWLYHVDAIGGTLLTGQQVSGEGLFFTNAGWVNSPLWCECLLQHPNIELHCQTRVNRLQPITEGWKLSLQTETHEHSITTAAVILANAAAANTLWPDAGLALKAIRGQVSILRQSSQQKIQTVVCRQGYIAPAQYGQHWIGASYNLHDTNTDIRATEHQINLDHIAEALPNMVGFDQKSVLGGWASVRAVTPDYMPLVGPVSDQQALQQRFYKLSQDANYCFTGAPRHWAGLYINAGHGSKGLITCPLAAELLASLIANEPLPVSRSLAEALNPARFIIRNLIRRKIS